MNISTEKQQVLNGMVDALSRIEGVRAIVLGGSHAMGMASEASDLDLGLYYRPDAPFDIEQIRAVATQFTQGDPPTVTGFYAWGPWVNGGAWIKTAVGDVDFIYKNIDQVRDTIDKAGSGAWENHYEQQPPYGFSSIIFLAETHYCRPLYDPEGILAATKARVRDYPVKLRASVVQDSLWSAAFSIWQGDGFAGKADMYNTLGCMTRAVKGMVNALFALNCIYPMGDKRALEILGQAAVKPADLTGKVNRVLSAAPASLPENMALLRQLFNETVALSEGLYTPYFDL